MPRKTKAGSLAGMLGLLSLLPSATAQNGAMVVSDNKTATLGSLSFSMVEGTQGQLYGTYVDLNGVLMVTTCKTNCKQAANWQRVNVTQDKFNSNIARIQVDRKGGLHVMRLVGEHLSQMTAIYSSCTADCLKSNSWKHTRIPALFNVARYQLTNDWFALDQQGRPRFLTVNGFFSSANELQDRINENVIYTSCNQNCHTPANWTFTPVASAGRMNGVISSGVLRFDGKNRLHAVAAVDGRLTYLTCPENCEQQGQWKQVALPVKLSEFYRTQRGYDLALDGTGTLYLPFTYDNEPGQPAQLWLFSCAGNCTSAANWKKVNLSAHPAFPKNPLDSGIEPAATVAGNKLLVAFQTANQKNRPPQRLYVMSCASGCQSAQGQWSARLAFNSENVELPHREPYKYMYTALHTQAMLPSGHVAFTAVPHWGLNYTRLIDRPGASLVPVSDSDFQWVPIPQLAW